MAQLPTSGIPLFRLFRIQVYLHWSWFLIALIQIQNPVNRYSSRAWNVAEYLTLFGIVLMHEFGHALACRSVGGEADRIMLWPLGGVAFVQPPPRPGPMLWSIAAGPLVNLILVPITFGLVSISGAWGAFENDSPMTDPQRFVIALATINLLLLIFNMLPIYPLDGGQILRSILWFFIGPAKSLMIASVIGLAGAGIGMVAALMTQDIWLIVIGAFAAMQSWSAFQRSKRMGDPMMVSRRELRCPNCGANPPAGPFWMCPCGNSFDVFASQGRCPRCGGVFMAVPCPACSAVSAPGAWLAQSPPLVSSAIPPTIPPQN